MCRATVDGLELKSPWVVVTHTENPNFAGEDLTLRELDVTSVRETAGTCPQTESARPEGEAMNADGAGFNERGRNLRCCRMRDP
jgi:hypothetical protein